MSAQKRKQAIITIAEIILLFFLLWLGGMLLRSTDNLQGTARVVNYAGIIRGGTQRLIKLECIGQTNTELEQSLDDILSGLKREEDSAHLISLPDPVYQQNLSDLIGQWQLIKQELILVRQNGYQATDIVSLSERHYELANETVFAAEQYAQSIASRIDTMESLLIANILLLAVLMLSQYWRALKDARASRLLAANANIDAHTGLPNKNRCEALIKQTTPVTEPICVLVFDLNNLKETNDRFGHSAGDEMIRDFSCLLRAAFREDDFVGRCGGDEFLVIAWKTQEGEIERPMRDLLASTAEHNSAHRQTPISFAYGAAYSQTCEKCTLRTLFDQADRAMYDQKRRIKALGADRPVQGS